MKDEGSAGATVENTHEPLAEDSGRKYGADLQQQGYFFLPRDKAIVEAIAIDMNEGFTSANAPYIRDRYLPQRLAVNNPESVTEKGQPHGRDV
jgi:hypothetical protein